MLEMACGFLFEYPNKLRRLLLNNWLVNPTGLLRRWHEGDLLQEHHNREIKSTRNTKNAQFDSRWMQVSVALNIVALSLIRRNVARLFGLHVSAYGRSQVSVEKDIERLAHRHKLGQILTYTKGRQQPFVAINARAVGRTKLSDGQLAAFLEKL